MCLMTYRLDGQRIYTDSSDAFGAKVNFVGFLGKFTNYRLWPSKYENT